MISNTTTEKMYQDLGISREVYSFCQEILTGLEPRFKEIDEKEKNCMAVTAAADYLVTFREGYYYKDAFLKRTQPFSMQEKISIIKKILV